MLLVRRQHRSMLTTIRETRSLHTCRDRAIPIAHSRRQTQRVNNPARGPRVTKTTPRRRKRLLALATLLIPAAVVVAAAVAAAVAVPLSSLLVVPSQSYPRLAD